MNGTTYPLFPTPVSQHKLNVGLNVIDTLEGNKFFPYYDNNRTSIINYLDFDTLSYEKDQIVRMLEEYVYEICGFTEQLTPEICSSWASVNKKDHYVARRSHSNSIISGIWCIVSGEESGSLRFYPPTKLLGSAFEFDIIKGTSFNSENFQFPLSSGDVYIFPSNLQYDISKNLSDKDLLYIGFNCMLRGSIFSENTFMFL